VLAVLTVNLGPTLVYQLSHGGNSRVQHRATEGDDLALSPSYLLLPPLHGRIGPLRRVTERYAAVTQPHGYREPCFESIGSVGDVGFLWLAVVAFAALLGAPVVMRRAGIQRDIAVGVAACLAIGVGGGLSSLTRVFVTSDIRAWNRLSVVIAFFSLLTVGLLFDALRARLSGRVARRLLGPLMAAVLLFGIVDQTSSYFAPNYAKDRTQYQSDAQFVSDIERRLPPGAEVLELPYVPFPEGYQPFLAPDQTVPFSQSMNFEYELAREYIHSDSLRWSYGAMKGRAADWQAQLAAKPVEFSVAGAAAAGFQGLVVDPRGYPGALSTELAQDLRRQLGVSPVLSPSGDLLFYDLRPYERRLQTSQPAQALQALRAAVLEPLRLTCSTGQLTIHNPGRSTQTAMLTAQVSAASPARLQITSANGFARTVSATARPAALQESIQLPPGRTNLTIARLGSGVQSAQLLAPTVIARAFDPFAGRPSETLRSGIIGPPCASVAAR
jgi:phosphoglycerol transferase